MKIVRAINLTEDTYKKFQMKCLVEGKSVSSEIDKFIKKQVKGWHYVSDNTKIKE